MPFEKGHTNVGGRPKGSQNKDRKICREIIESCLNKSIPERLLEIATKNPQKEADILLSLMPYCYPKLQAVDLTGILEASLDAGAGLQAAVDHIDHLLKIKAEMKK